MENNINEELELNDDVIDEEEKEIFYQKLTSSLEDTLINFNISGDEDDR